MDIHSPAFEHHQPIPKKYTCEGENISPALEFRNVPAGTKSLALIVDDPDAPNGTFDHWLLWNITPASKGLSENAKVSTPQGKNHYGELRYKGPCPPPGKPHRYFFKLYALDSELKIPEGSDKKTLEGAMEGHILARAELVGTYKR